MFINIITDCISPNDKGRQSARFSALFNSHVNFTGIKSTFNSLVDVLQTGGCLIDLLDAGLGKEGVLVANIANRGDRSKYKNGNPFAYFFYQKTLVIITVDETVEGFLKEFGITDRIYITDIKTALTAVASEYNLDKAEIDRIKNSQFRSYDYVPYLAHAVMQKLDLPAEEVLIENSELPAGIIWYVDAFGNCKLTSTSCDQESIKTKAGTFKYYQGLRQVPAGETGIYTGSSGIGNKRFLELSVQKGNAAKQYNLQVGDQLY